MASKITHLHQHLVLRPQLGQLTGGLAGPGQRVGQRHLTMLGLCPA